MKIVVIGGTGLIGSKTVAILRQGGHEVVAASPKSGINSITGEGLNAAMTGAQVVIDLANSPSFEDKAVLDSSRPPAVTCSRRRPQPASGTMSRYPSLEPTGPTTAISAPRSPRRNWSRPPASPTPSCAQPSFWSSSAASPLQVRTETECDSLRSCSSPSQRTTLPPSLPMWRSNRRETASSKSPAPSERRSTRSSPAI